MTHFSILTAFPFVQAVLNGLLCVPTYIDAKQREKLQYFPKILRNFRKIVISKRIMSLFRPAFCSPQQLVI